MTWSEAHTRKVEQAILNACADTIYANGIDELFDGDTWVIDFYELASHIRDSLESECEELDIEEIPERIYKKYVDKKINEYIENFKNNMQFAQIT